MLFQPVRTLKGTASKSVVWYFHRLRAMNAMEIFRRFQVRSHRKQDKFWEIPNVAEKKLQSCRTSYPLLPQRNTFPDEYLNSLHEKKALILSGKWFFWGKEISITELPPVWQKDYLTGENIGTEASAFSLNHRNLKNADVKCIWELSRWNELVQLAQIAWLCDAEEAASKCIDWINNWVKCNPPFSGYNWTSALETGTRLIQFSWIDALLTMTGIPEDILTGLRKSILPAHFHYTLRHRSFGSSANNHLLGELAGLLIAGTRWPELKEFYGSIQDLAHEWSREVLKQFAPDGGNREQALNYHLYSYELCLQTLKALQIAGIKYDPMVEIRMEKARAFFLTVHGNEDSRWEYGDSDDAYSTPLFSKEKNRIADWKSYLAGKSGNALSAWLGPDEKNIASTEKNRWHIFSDTGVGAFHGDHWFARLDASPLGYLSTAAHGHLDALHLSLWINGAPFLIDPGTGAYYGDLSLRNTLSDRSSHNGPEIPDCPFAIRQGSFLWAAQHPAPGLLSTQPNEATASISLHNYYLTRRVAAQDSIGWLIQDSIRSSRQKSLSISCNWIFAPEWEIQAVPEEPNAWEAIHSTVKLRIEFFSDPGQSLQLRSVKHEVPCSPHFREVLKTQAIRMEIEGSETANYTIKIIRQ